MKNKVHASENNSKRLLVFGTCIHLHAIIGVGPMHNYKINPQAEIVFFLGPYQIYLLITSHKYTPEQSKNVIY